MSCPGVLVVVLLGEKHSLKQLLLKELLNSEERAQISSDCVVGENNQLRVICAPDIFSKQLKSSFSPTVLRLFFYPLFLDFPPVPLFLDPFVKSYLRWNFTDRYNSDPLVLLRALQQHLLDITALSLPGPNLFLLAVDPDNANEQTVAQWIKQLQSYFGDTVCSHLLVALPDLESFRTLRPLQESFGTALTMLSDNIILEWRRWCKPVPFVFKYPEYGELVKRRERELRSSVEYFTTGPAEEQAERDRSSAGSQTKAAIPAPEPDARQSQMQVPAGFFNIILLGSSGVGKSSSGNTILAAAKERPCVRNGAHSGRHARLFHDKIPQSQNQVEKCRKFLIPGHFMVLLVLRVDRFRQPDLLQRLEQKLGVQFREDTWLLLTHGEELEGRESEFFNRNPELKKVAEQCRYKSHSFNNKKRISRQQVVSLLEKIPQQHQSHICAERCAPASTLNLEPSVLNSSFTFKDKEYESASAALDAYITDFERGHHGSTSKRTTFRLPLSSPRKTSLRELRNRDVLRERLSEQELNYLTLPVSSLRHRDNRDRISMTTDELLNLPNDGSMPITHTSAFLHGLVSKSGLSQTRSPVKKNTSSQSHTHIDSQPIRTLHCSRCGAGVVPKTYRETPFSSTLKFDPQASSSHWARPASADQSECRSLRDNQSERRSLRDSQSEQFGLLQQDQSEQMCEQDQSQGGEIEDFPASAPSWVLELNEEQLVDSEETLRNLRLQFAQHISQMVTDRSNSVDSLYTDRRIQSLIQKADRVLDSLQNSTTGSPVPPVNADQTQDLDQELEPALKSDPQTSGAGSQPGLLEAIKQILFRLQAVEMELHRRQDAQQDTLLQRAPQQAHTPTQIPEADEEEASLQRALHHLSRLKLLVENTEDHQNVLKLNKNISEEERDEGRFSSCSIEHQQGATQGNLTQ
ncbi:hypothetical protein WMY93_019586 [Mugilogobius chulae]|uniref:AIG1-type G domain-containing protein n=1 Tax=Mugilogobius chulae TaxID=88201 RepID=A0AAW0NG02_9GOBI